MVKYNLGKDEIMDIEKLKNDLREEKAELPLVISKDSEGNNYYYLEKISLAYYVPKTTWSGTINENEIEQGKKAIVLHPLSNLSDEKGINGIELLNIINSLGLENDTLTIIEKGRGEGSPYDGLTEAYYNKKGPYGWGQAVIYHEEEFKEDKEYFERFELNKENMNLSIVLFPIN